MRYSGLFVLNRRHEPRNGVRAASRVEHAVSRSIVHDFADLELVGHSFRQLSAETVRLLHFARITQRVRRAIMLVMQEDGKLRSDGLALGCHRLFEELILQVLGQVTPESDNSFA
jgi:hypothetical protein